MKKTLLCIAFSILGVYSYGQRRPLHKAVPFKDANAAKAYLQNQADSLKFSGNVLVMQNGKDLIKESYGLASKEKNIPINIDTKINLGSINKAFTAVCVLQLIEAGKINFEDKITKYIPELKANMANEISIRNLLEMKSGLGSYWDSPIFLDNYKNLRNLEDYVPIIAAYSLSSKPGTERQYSNSSYELLGILVQRVSGQNYYDYVRENVYKKAGMVNTDAFERDKSVQNLAQGYSKFKVGEDFETQLPPERQYAFNYNVNDRSPVKGTAAGGGFSTVDDMKQFVYTLTSNQLLSKTSTDLLINHFRDSPDRNPVYNIRGGSTGINSVVFYNASKDLLIIVLCNYDPPVGSEVARRLIATFNS
ncbi:serine hydrolase domain-containing protein [Flagellimonas nanhaiensis]|nr:serine hydrolase domain-containing protein [Allomuricauda nanhaiensis]